MATPSWQHHVVPSCGRGRPSVQRTAARRYLGCWSTQAAPSCIPSIWHAARLLCGAALSLTCRQQAGCAERQSRRLTNTGFAEAFTITRACLMTLAAIPCTIKMDNAAA